MVRLCLLDCLGTPKKSMGFFYCVSEYPFLSTCPRTLAVGTQTE